MKKFLVLALLLLAACKQDVSTITKISTVYVDRPAPCPNKTESDRLVTTRPVPLRDQSMPSTRIERTAQATAQLGKYESEGGWGDQVVSALKRCQVK
jgi:hypothetical protein